MDQMKESKLESKGEAKKEELIFSFESGESFENDLEAEETSSESTSECASEVTEDLSPKFEIFEEIAKSALAIEEEPTETNFLETSQAEESEVKPKFDFENSFTRSTTEDTW